MVLDPLPGRFRNENGKECRLRRDGPRSDDTYVLLDVDVQAVPPHWPPSAQVRGRRWRVRFNERSNNEHRTCTSRNT